MYAVCGLPLAVEEASTGAPAVPVRSDQPELGSPGAPTQRADCTTCTKRPAHSFNEIETVKKGFTGSLEGCI